MTERDARAIAAMRALETTDRECRIATDDDRAWSSRAAAEAVGDAASPSSWLSHRATLLLERVGGRHPAFARVVEAFEWRRWIAPACVLAAFGAGALVDRLGDSGRINLIAPPLLGLLAWNVAVYAILFARSLGAGRARLAQPAQAGPVRRALVALAARRTVPRAAQGGLHDVVAAFVAQWAHDAGPVYAARAARVLHLAAAALAAGILAGLYLRGLAFEYRASWSSTFLDAAEVRSLLAFLLAPGHAVSGVAVPDAAHLASIRAGSMPGSENAAPWLHLIAATVALVVILPRLMLAAVAWIAERRRAAHLHVPLDAPYFRRLLREHEAGPTKVVVVPYSFAVPAAHIERLRTILRRACGPVDVTELAPVGYGTDDVPGDALPGALATLRIALFNAAATPEAETHGAFAQALAALAGHDTVALIDEASWRARWPGDEQRLAQRRKAWQDVLAGRGAAFAFVDLAQPDIQAAGMALQSALKLAPP